MRENCQNTAVLWAHKSVYSKHLFVYPRARTHRLYYPHFHSTFIICGCDNVTCDPRESPSTQRSRPVKPVNVFHMVSHMPGSAPYAPPSHSSLSHTIFWISNSDDMTSYNPGTSFHIIGLLLDCRGFLLVCFLLVTPIPVSPWAPWWTVFWGFSMKAKAEWQLWDLMVLFMINFPWAGDSGNESCVVHRSFHMGLSFLIRDKAEALSKHPHVLSLRCPRPVSC